MIGAFFTTIACVVATQAPPGWSCDPERYADGLCDCGCSVFDLDDCVDNSSGSCDINRCGAQGLPQRDDNSRCDGALQSVEPPPSSCGAGGAGAAALTPILWMSRCRRRLRTLLLRHGKPNRN